MCKEPVCFRSLTANLDLAQILPFSMSPGIRLGQFRAGNLKCEVIQVAALKSHDDNAQVIGKLGRAASRQHKHCNGSTCVII